MMCGLGDYGERFGVQSNLPKEIVELNSPGRQMLLLLFDK